MRLGGRSRGFNLETGHDIAAKSFQPIGEARYSAGDEVATSGTSVDRIPAAERPSVNDALAMHLQQRAAATEDENHNTTDVQVRKIPKSLFAWTRAFDSVPNQETDHGPWPVSTAVGPRPEDIIFKKQWSDDTVPDGVGSTFTVPEPPTTTLGIGSRHFESSTERLFRPPLTDQSHWRSWFTFQACSIAVLCNLGTIWRFQSLALENHAGSFVLAYLLSWLFVGLPVLVLEQMVGQFGHKSPWGIWSCVPLFRGIAVGQCILSTYLTAMYCIVMAWTGIYFATSFARPLPWNTSVVEVGTNMSCRNLSDAEQYFRNDVLHLTDLDSMSSCDWRAIVAVLIAIVLVILLLVHQRKIFEVLAPTLAALAVVLFAGLLVYACTGEGAADGIAYFFTPQWDQLGSQVWYSALTQVVYSHNVGLGVHVTISGCNGFKWPVVRCAIATGVLAMLFSLLCGTAVFALLGNLARTMGVDVGDAVQLEYGLVFIVVSNAVATTAQPQAWAAAIFAVLFVCGAVSPATYVLNIVVVACGQFGQIFRRNWMAVLPVVFVAFLIVLVFTTEGGLFFLKIFDAYGVSVPSLICLALETVGLLWIYGLKLFHQDFNLMTSSRGKWIASVSFATPCIILVVAIAAFAQFHLVTLDGMEIPAWGHGLGGGLLILAILPIVVYMIHVTRTQLEYGFLGKLQMAVKPTSNWGPNEHRPRQMWLTKRVESFNGDRKRRPGDSASTKPAVDGEHDSAAESMPDIIRMASDRGGDHTPPDSRRTSPTSDRSQDGTEEPSHLKRDSTWALY